MTRLFLKSDWWKWCYSGLHRKTSSPSPCWLFCCAVSVYTTLPWHIFRTLGWIDPECSSWVTFHSHPFPVWLPVVQVRQLLTHLESRSTFPSSEYITGSSCAGEPHRNSANCRTWHPAVHQVMSLKFKWSQITARYCGIHVKIIVLWPHCYQLSFSSYLNFWIWKFHISLNTHRLMLLCTARVSRSQLGFALFLPASSWTLTAALAALLQMPRPSLDSRWLERSLCAIGNPRVLQPLVFTLKIRRPF